MPREKGKRSRQTDRQALENGTGSWARTGGSRTGNRTGKKDKEAERKWHNGTMETKTRRGERRYTDLTSRLLESRFFLDLGGEHPGGSMGRRRERTVSARHWRSFERGARGPWRCHGGWVPSLPARANESAAASQHPPPQHPGQRCTTYRIASQPPLPARRPPPASPSLSLWPPLSAPRPRFLDLS